MLLTLINDNASVLNLSRVQPYLEGVDAEIDGDEEGGGDAASEVAFDEPEVGLAVPSGEQEKRTGVRFEESSKAGSTTTTTDLTTVATTSNRDIPPWYADPGQTTPGGMRLADIMHAGTAATSDKSPFGASAAIERPATSVAAQQLLDFGSGYAAHPWNGENSSVRTGEDFASHARARRHVSSDRRTREGSSSGREDESGARPPVSRAPSLTEHHAALALEVRLFPLPSSFHD